ncbi:MAG TPA: diguanylate cyclase [Candidatus Baltobacteraceae bacterium]|jgi:diguanylate cyclase (GGDEF)-like protein|nr:diguanylate cyclase [Candidatus Baltobacteraceae bacterium]
MDRQADPAAALVRDVAGLVAESPAPYAFYEGVAAALARTFGAREVVLGISEGGEFREEYAKGAEDGSPVRALLHDDSVRSAAALGRVTVTPLPDGIAHLVAIPLHENGRTSGVLAATVDVAPSPVHSLLLETLGIQIAGYLRAANSELQSRSLRELALCDPLTGIANRRAFDEARVVEWARAGRTASPLSLVICDVDFFGLYNTRYGHPAGDECLRRIAAAIADTLERKADLLARYGGEEFCAILPSTDLAGAIVVAERIRDAVFALNIPHEGTQLRRVTMSAGVASALPGWSSDSQSLVDAADKMLLDAKERGRNRIVANDYESESPANVRRYERRHNIPSDITRFVGRDRELFDIGFALSNHRLVTLLGPGGVGKTRASSEAAREFSERLADGARFADLSHAHTMDAAISGLAHDLDVQLRPNQPPIDALLEQLTTREQLVVLDNCEQIVDALAGIVERILHASSGIRVLATSREALGIAGEKIYRLEPMQSVDARQLLVERLRAAAGDAAAGLPEADIASICDKLDNLPLAIEIVAPRLAELGAHETLSRLDRPGFALSVSLRNNRERQQTISNLLEWSYQLLAPRSQAVLRRLGTFYAGCDERAAIAVCAGPDCPSEAVRACLDELARKSLLIVDAQSGRFRMLELASQFAREQLRKSGEEPERRLLHAREYSARGAAIDADARAARFAQANASFSAEWPNLIAALRTLLIDGADPNLGAELAAHLAFMWDASGRVHEARYWLDQALAHEDLLSRLVLAEVEYSCGFLSNTQADHDGLRRHGTKSAALFEECGERRKSMHARQLIANADMFQGRYDEARDLQQQILRDALAINDRRHIASSLINLGVIAADRGRLRESEKLYERSIDILRTMDSPHSLGIALMNLSETKRDLGEREQSVVLVEEAIEISERAGSKSVGIGLCNLASTCMEIGDLEKARASLRKAMNLYAEFPPGRWASNCFEQCARFATLRGEHVVAAQICGFIEAYRARHDIVLPSKEVTDYQNLCERIKEALGGRAFETCISDGSRWSVEKAFNDVRRML